MLEKLEYTNVDGENIPCDIVVYALSTCGFCRRGLQFLRDNKLKHKYVYVDQLSNDLRQRVKLELTKRYEERIAFPYVVIDNGKRIIVGFTEERWKEAFLQK